MITRQVSDTKASALASMLCQIKNGSSVSNEAFHSIQAKGNAMLVEPVNGDPFVFCSPNTVFVFDHDKKSGTDFLRQRIFAQNFFNEISAESKTPSKNKF